MTRRSHRCSLGCVALFLIALTTACTRIPVEELRTYLDAFQEARAAGDLILDKVSPIISAHDGSTADSCALRASGRAPRCFSRELALAHGETPDPPSVQARRSALEVVAKYNALLADYADGRSAEALRGQMAQFAEIAQLASTLMGGGTLAPVFGTVVSGLTGFLERLENARSAEAMKDVLIAGRPVVQGILRALADDAPSLYDIYLGHQTRKQNLLARQQGDALANNMSDETFRLGRAAITEDLVNYHNALGSYVRVLSKTEEALDVLAEAAINPPVTVESTRDLIREAIEIRNEAEAFWRAVRRRPASGTVP